MLLGLKGSLNECELDLLHQRSVEARREKARRAQKQFDTADPENWLVADELERRWNQSLQRVREIETRIQQHRDREGTPIAPTRSSVANWAMPTRA